ncbi:unnamed protein product [Adineta steineri]|uniref:Uncharacterized protein n=1 Tax=Adineta steineri TaxID=433720 RepID=A0A815FG58_9BILA|nr:unnamed protein product [Adineta steineri]CAF1323081.1 unnamed protein product [Adineta steineri]CAF1325509.1 unnamed protein product [Adineta steineri]
MGEPNRRFSFSNVVRRLPQMWRGRPAEVERPQTSTLRNESAQATVSPPQQQSGAHHPAPPDCPPLGYFP